MARRRGRQFSQRLRPRRSVWVKSSDAPMDHCAAVGHRKGAPYRWSEAAQPALRERLTEDERSELPRVTRSVGSE